MLDVPKAIRYVTTQGWEPSFTQQTTMVAGTSVFLLLSVLPEALCEAEDVDIWVTRGSC